MTHLIEVSGAVSLADENIINGNVRTEEVHVGGSVAVPTGSYYRGEYTITPGTEAQTLAIEGMTALRDITINPIPSNYGLVTWDGSTITVS